MNTIKSAVPGWLDTLKTLEETLTARSPPRGPVPTSPSPPTALSQPPPTTTNPPSKIKGYTLHHRIGTGSFGVLYAAVEDATEKKVAFKFESSGCESPQLRDEYRAYKLLAGCKGICNAYALGEEALHNYMIIDQLGPSLEMLFSKCKCKFSLKTVCMLGIQMIDRLRSIHSHNLIYRDIKPQNFLLGPPTDPVPQVYLVDLGMVKEYIDPITKSHIRPSSNRALSGTVQFLSNNAVRAQAQSRRDDLESLLLVLVYFANNGLPWATAGNTEVIAKIKQETTPEALCAGLPPQFQKFLLYTRAIPFDAKPDYDHLQSLLTAVLTDLGTTNDLHFDWLRTPTVTSLRPLPYSTDLQFTLYTLHKSIAATRYQLMRAVRNIRAPPHITSTLSMMNRNPLGPRPARANAPPPADEQLNKAQKTLVALADKVLRDTNWKDDIAIIRAAILYAGKLAEVAETSPASSTSMSTQASTSTRSQSQSQSQSQSRSQTPPPAKTATKSTSPTTSPEEAATIAAAAAAAAATSTSTSTSSSPGTTRVYRRPVMMTRPTSKDKDKEKTPEKDKSRSHGHRREKTPENNLPPPPAAPMGKGAAPPEPTASALLPRMDEFREEVAPLEVDEVESGSEGEDEEEEAFVVEEYHNGKKERGAMSLGLH